MTNQPFTGVLGALIARAEQGQPEDVDHLMGRLTPDATLAMTRFVDFALSRVTSEEGIRRLEHYLFKGTLMQRNYSSLFFNRRLDFDLVKQAYDQGRIDEIQAFAR